MEAINQNIRAGWRILLAVFILFLISQLYAKCENENQAYATIKALRSENEIYRLKNGQLVYSAKVATLSENQLKENLSKVEKELLNKFSKPKTFTKYITNTKFDTITITYKDSVPCKFERDGALFTKEYNLAYKSNQKGITITELAIPDSVLIATGYKRKWFLGKKTLTMDITHSNKFVQSDQVQHFEIQEKKKFYQTDLFKIGIGLIGGYLIAK